MYLIDGTNTLPACTIPQELNPNNGGKAVTISKKSKTRAMASRLQVEATDDEGSGS